jgi:RimJ/RimL family protein N-acetyltransferase
VHLIPSSLPCLRLLVAGDLAAAELDSGLTFSARIWPDDAEMREGLAVHLAACERDAEDLAWRVYLIAGEHDAAIGHAGFKGGPTRGGELEIYWCVEPRWRGQGIAKAAAASLCRYAFASSAVSVVTATIARNNIASQHVAAALGMYNAGEVKHGMPLWRVSREQWRPFDLLNRQPMRIVARAPAP